MEVIAPVQPPLRVAQNSLATRAHQFLLSSYRAETLHRADPQDLLMLCLIERPHRRRPTVYASLPIAAQEAIPKVIRATSEFKWPLLPS